MLLLPQTAKRLLRPLQPKLKEDGVKHNRYVGQLGSTFHVWTLRLMSTFLLGAFTTSSGNNLETSEKLSSVQIRGKSFFPPYGQNKDWEQCNILHGKMRLYIGRSKLHPYLPEVYVVCLFDLAVLAS